MRKLLPPTKWRPAGALLRRGPVLAWVHVRRWPLLAFSPPIAQASVRSKLNSLARLNGSTPRDRIKHHRVRGGVAFPPSAPRWCISVECGEDTECKYLGFSAGGGNDRHGLLAPLLAARPALGILAPCPRVTRWRRLRWRFPQEKKARLMSGSCRNPSPSRISSSVPNRLCCKS